MAPPKPIPKPAPKPAPKPVPRPPPVIIINPGTGNTNNPNCYRPDNTYSCPVDITRRKRSNGLYVGIAFAAMFALVVLILAAIHFARWRARRRALKERAALVEVEGKLVDNSDGLTAAAFGGAGGGVVVGGVDGVDGGVSGMEQIQDQAIAMPYGVPTYPMPTPNVFVNPASSELKEYVDEKVEAGGLSFLPISSRPDTPAEETPEVPYTSPPSSILPTDNTVIINKDHTPITNASSDGPGPKEEWTPESFHIPDGSVDIPPSSKQ